MTRSLTGREIRLYLALLVVVFVAGLVAYWRIVLVPHAEKQTDQQITCISNAHSTSELNACGPAPQ